MNNQTTALLVQEGGKLVTQLLMLYPPKRQKPSVTPPDPDISQEIPEPPVAEAEPIAVESEASGIKAGCVPCAIGHFSTCSGLLAESMRFVRSDGLNSNEVIDRVSHCLEELNAMEREDLSPQKIHQLPPWEKELAIMALDKSRATRHALEGIASENDLEAAAAGAQEFRQEISREWFKHRLERSQN